mgnify:CR=1 FL=1
MPSNIREFVALMSTQLNTDVLDNIQEHFFAQLIQTKWRKKYQEALSKWFFYEFRTPFAQQPISLIFDKTFRIIRNHNKSLSGVEDCKILDSVLDEYSVSQREYIPTGLVNYLPFTTWIGGLTFSRFVNAPFRQRGAYFFSYGSTSMDRILWSSKDTSSDLAGKMSQNKPLYAHFLVVIENSICHFLHLPEKPYENVSEFWVDSVWYVECYFLSYSEIWRINSKGQVVSKCPYLSE